MRNIVIAAILAAGFTSSASAVDVDEQTRRCNNEKTSLKNPRHEEGPECLKLRAMLGMPEPTVIKNNYYLQGNQVPSNCRREGNEVNCYY